MIGNSFLGDKYIVIGPSGSTNQFPDPVRLHERYNVLVDSMILHSRVSVVYDIHQQRPITTANSANNRMRVGLGTLLSCWSSEEHL